MPRDTAENGRQPTRGTDSTIARRRPRFGNGPQRLIEQADMEHMEDAAGTFGRNEGSTEVDIPRIERAVREIMIAIDEDPDREGLLNRPNRIARAYAKLTAGPHMEPRVYVKTVIHE